MNGLLIVLVIAIVVGVIGWLMTQRSAPNKSPSVPVERDLFTLQIGDIVQYEGDDWVVESRLTFDDDGFTWLEYLLMDGDHQCWLAVEEDDWLEVSLLHKIDDLVIAGTPPAELTYQDLVYRLRESGTANMHRTARTGQVKAERCEYFDYEGTNQQVLSLENWSGSQEISVGHKIKPSALSLLPGDGQSVYRT
ncbi:MAG: DUF4178 domain-containing protein [Cyanobacteria bacterium P01_H01_bin.15]